MPEDFAARHDGSIQTSVPERAAPLLQVRDLTVEFPTADGVVHAVRGVDFAVRAGETLGIVGESGSGKSVACMSVIGLTRGAEISGTAQLSGRDLLSLSETELQAVRGREIGMVFQDPLSSLHPLYRVGWQIAEVIRAHERVSRRAAAARAVELLGLVGIPAPARRAEEFPHEFSGGMRQRVMIALALALGPRLLIADEPTTALDVTVQAQIIELIQRLQAELSMAVIMVTHDLGVIAGMADRVVVMYAGRVVEDAACRAIYYSAAHPYTRGLLASLPVRSRGAERLAQIPGQPPSMLVLPPGCAFRPRCGEAIERCATSDPPLIAIGEADQRAACWRCVAAPAPAGDGAR